VGCGVSWTVVVVAALSALVLSGAGGLATEIGPWYRALRKPSWQPPNWAFGPAWTLILGMAAASGALAWTAAPDGAARGRVVALFAANALFHFVWSPLFFRLKRPDWALYEVVLLWLSCLALIVGLADISTSVSLLIVPYLLWVTFAAFLNLAVVRLNRPF